MKKKNPPNKSPIFKILGDSLGGGADGNGGENNLQLDSIGCTANAILVEDMKKLYVANAGDSRSVLCRNGVAVPLSYDHKPENDEERRRIENAGSTITEGRVDGNLNLSRSLGDLKYK
jgi:serine/threonine protein phosphatase PrpC